MIPILSGNVASAIGGGYEVANSCRFDDGSSSKLSKSISSSGNRKTWTWSAWIKRGNIAGANMDLFGTQYTGLAKGGLYIDTSERLYYSQYEAGGASNNVGIRTNRVFRDTSAWFHVCLIWDTTDSTGDDRIRLYINGTRETSLGINTNPSLNLDGVVNLNTHDLFVGGEVSTLFFDGYMCEVVFIDGQALTPDNFGEFDEDTPTVWKPKDVSGLTFGTNGFYLDFEDSSNLGNDANGGTDFTESNLAATDQSTDTCTNNFCTLNPLYNAYVDPTFSEGNLKITQSSSWAGAKATMGVSTGKWYWEIKLTGTMSDHQHGVQQENVNESAQNPQNTTGSTVFYNHDGGEMNTDGSNTSADYGTFSSGDIMGLALDMDAGSYGQITIYKNGSAIVSNFNLSSSSTTVMPFASIGNSTAEYNFGSPSFAISSGNSDGNGYGNFEYSVPSGFYSLCTKNLAEYG